MRREDIHTIVTRFQAEDVAKVVLVLRAGFGISVDIFYRFEPEYVVVRGREAGTNDDGRGFFVPYDEVVYLKLERVIHPNELRQMYGDPIIGLAEHLEEELDEAGAAGSVTATPAPVAQSVAQPTAPMTPGDIARQNLLERIRAARTSVTSAKVNGK